MTLGAVHRSRKNHRHKHNEIPNHIHRHGQHQFKQHNVRAIRSNNDDQDNRNNQSSASGTTNKHDPYGKTGCDPNRQSIKMTRILNIKQLS